MSNNFMTNSLLAGVLLVSIAGFAEVPQDQSQSGAPNAGQAGEPHRGHGGDHMERLAEALNLTDQQKQQLKDYQQQHRPETEQLRKDTSLTREQKHEKMQALRQQHDQFMASILTPDQKTKWEQLKQRHQQQEGGEEGHHHAGENQTNPQS
jgi:Spy/CpxP family protein refolding chaperone